jgi:hypothetical protein
MRFRLTATLLQAVLCIPVAAWATGCSQKAGTESLGWDLSYSSVLDANAVGSDEWLRRWVGPNYQSSAKGWISSWRHGPIQSSVLLEFPAHAGERVILWLVRTKEQAYFYERAEGNPLSKDDKPPSETNQTLDVQAYDKFFSVVSTWQQGQRAKAEDIPNGAIPGYTGCLSIYGSGSSRQILLTSDDFAICETKECKTPKLGRLLEALKIIPSLARSSSSNQLSARAALTIGGGHLQFHRSAVIRGDGMQCWHLWLG